MKTGTKIFLAIAAVIVVIALWMVGRYNTLVVANNAIDAQWAQVDSVLQRRFDSIEQTVGGLKVANKNEQDALQKITDARKIYTAASGDSEAQVAAANNYAGALNGLLLSRTAIGENYPNLKTPELVGGLISGVTVEGNENRINVERMRYNDLVRDFNTSVSTFPGNLLASTFGFAKRSYFEIANEASRNALQIAPNLNF
jgi:LemA protein